MYMYMLKQKQFLEMELQGILYEKNCVHVFVCSHDFARF